MRHTPFPFAGGVVKNVELFLWGKMMDIKPIETVYNGYRFRSRLEARWAVFFDALGVKYEYEAEGYDLGEAGWYLPDFWLPEVGAWVEIKGDLSSEDEKKKCHLLASGTKKPVLLISGQPAHKPHFEEFPHIRIANYSLVVFFGYAWPCLKFFPFSSWVYKITFVSETVDGGDNPALYKFLKEKGYNPPAPQLEYKDFSILEDQVKKYIEIDQEYFRKKYQKPHWKWEYGFSQKDLACNYIKNQIVFDIGDIPLSAETINALDDAKQARFEHGENGVL